MKKKLTPFIVSLMIYSIVVTPFVYGQTSVPKQLDKEIQISEKALNTSKYLPNYTGFAKNGQITSVDGFENEMAKVEKVLTAAAKKNPGAGRQRIHRQKPNNSRKSGKSSAGGKCPGEFARKKCFED